MKERPILFSAPMVRAILEGRKNQTRRVIKPQPEWLPEVEQVRATSGFFWPIGSMGQQCGLPLIKSPYGQPGDRLWVRETFYCDHYLFPKWKENFSKHGDMRELLFYRATDCAPNGECYTGFSGETMDCPWSPSIHMPRWASRITLEIIGVRVERLKDISEDDARAEGIKDAGCTECGNHEPCGCANPSPDARDAFCYLWNNINGADSWAANPWVWVIEFKRI